MSVINKVVRGLLALEEALSKRSANTHRKLSDGVLKHAEKNLRLAKLKADSLVVLAEKRHTERSKAAHEQYSRALAAAYAERNSSLAEADTLVALAEGKLNRYGDISNACYAHSMVKLDQATKARLIRAQV